MGLYNYDYSRIVWLKLFMARPDFEHDRSEVLVNFEQALDIIKTVDVITQGIQKIVYLVGWQGLGHDDCYPEMERINAYLKRECDATARDSLLWLVDEAKKHHTVISFHGNIADEYAANASHAEIAAANAVVNGPDGSPAVIEVFNGRAAHKISYKQYYESGLFKKYWDRFMDAVPVREAGTVHLDNFCVAESLNPRTDVDEQIEARNKILDYIRACGIDVTSEYTYRELLWRADSPEHPIRRFYATANAALPAAPWQSAAIHCRGRIAAAWHMSNITPQECIEIPAAVYSGRLTDEALRNVFYGAMHGEDIWLEHGISPDKWVPLFQREFCTLQLPYIYLNRYKRLRLDESADADAARRFTAYFDSGVVSRAADMSIEKDDAWLKRGEDVILPLTDDNRSFIAWSTDGRSGIWNLPDAEFSECEIYEITPHGNRLLTTAWVVDHRLELSVEPGQELLLVGSD